MQPFKSTTCTSSEDVSLQNRQWRRIEQRKYARTVLNTGICCLPTVDVGNQYTWSHDGEWNSPTTSIIVQVHLSCYFSVHYGDIRLKIRIRIHSESIFGFTWQIECNSDVIWHHFVCLCCFRSYFAHFSYSLSRGCLFGAVLLSHS